MWTYPEGFARAAQGMMDAQMEFFTSMVHAWMDTGLNAAELNVDAVKTQLANATVATRLWLGAGIAAGTALAR